MNINIKRLPTHYLRERTIPPQSHITDWPDENVAALTHIDWSHVREPSIFLKETDCHDVPAVCADQDCYNWQNQIECSAHDHGLDGRCKNMQLQFPTFYPLALYKVHAGATSQFGLVSRGQIPAGALIVEYTGVARMESDVDTSASHYWMELEADLVIDASSSGSLARYVNHSCQPNAVFQSWMVPKAGSAVAYAPRVGLYALRNIEPNEVITADYRMASETPFNIVCECGQDMCNGYVDRDRWRSRPLPAEWTAPCADFDIEDQGSDDDSDRGDGDSSYRAANSTYRDTNSSSSQPSNEVASDDTGQSQSKVDEVSIFREHGWKFLHIPLDSRDLTSAFVNATNKFAKLDVCTSAYKKREKDGGWVVHVRAYGVVFVGRGPSQPAARRDGIKQCLECFHTGARQKLNTVSCVVPPKAVLGGGGQDPDAPNFRELPVVDFLLLARRALREFYETVDKCTISNPAERKDFYLVESAKLCATVHLRIRDPLILLKYLQVDPATINKGMRLVMPASVCLGNRNKRLEIGAAGRMDWFSRGFVIFNSHFGPCLVKTSPAKGFKDLSLALREHKCTLHNIVDAKVFRKRRKKEVTVANLIQDYATRGSGKLQRLATRSSEVYVGRIEHVLYPLQSASEVQMLVELIEKRSLDTLPGDYQDMLRKEITVDPEKQLDSLVMLGDRESALSSFVCAHQMGLTEQQYLSDKMEATKMMNGSSQMTKHGFSPDTASDEEWQTMRTIYERWSQYVSDSGLAGAHRVIQGGVDEWTMVGKNHAVNDAFFNALTGTSLAEKTVTMPRHDKGLSAVALTRAGKCFARGEYWAIMISESATNDQIRNIVSALKLFLSTRPGQPIQIFHVDDMRWATILLTRSLNFASDCPDGFDSTLVCNAKLPFINDGSEDYSKVLNLLDEGAHIDAIKQKCGSAGQMLDDVYRGVCRLSPAQMEAETYPVFDFFAGGRGFYSVGPLLHAAPGTMKVSPTTKCPRIVCLTVTSVGWDLYDGVHQRFIHQYHELFWGQLCFLCLAHTADSALVKGAHVSVHYLGVPLPSSAMWRANSIDAPWSKGRFFAVFVECVVRIMLPQHASQMKNGVKCVPGYEVVYRKRKHDGSNSLERYHHFFHRDDVSDAVIALWEYLNMPSLLREQRLSTRLSTAGVKVDFGSWAGKTIFEQLLCAYKIAAGHKTLDEETKGWASASQRGEGFTHFASAYRGKLDHERAKHVLELNEAQVGE